MYFALHAVRFAAVFALAGKNKLNSLTLLRCVCQKSLLSVMFLYHVSLPQLFIPASQQLTPAAMGGVYPTLIAVITTMTVETTVMRWDACSELVTPTQNLLAIMEGVYLLNTSAMV